MPFVTSALERPHGVRHRRSTSEDDTRSRADVGPAAFEDHKSCEWTTKTRLGQPQVPHRPCGNGRQASEVPRVRQDPRPLGLKRRCNSAELPAQNESRTLFQWDEEALTPVAGYHGTHRTHGGPYDAT